MKYILIFLVVGCCSFSVKETKRISGDDLKRGLEAAKKWKRDHPEAYEGKR